MQDTIEEILAAYNHIRNTLASVHVSKELLEQVDALTAPFFSDPVTVGTLTEILNEFGDFSDNILTPLLEQYVGSRTAQKVQFAIDDLITAVEHYRDRQLMNLNRSAGNSLSNFSVDRLNKRPHEFKTLMRTRNPALDSVFFPKPFIVETAFEGLNNSLAQMTVVTDGRNQSRFQRMDDLAILINEVDENMEATTMYTESIIPKLTLSPGQCLIELESFKIIKDSIKSKQSVGDQVHFRGSVKAIGWKKGDMVHMMHVSKEDTVIGMSVLGEIKNAGAETSSALFIGEYIVCDLNNISRAPRGFPNLYALDLINVCKILSNLPKNHLKQSFSYVQNDSKDMLNVEVQNPLAEELLTSFTQNLQITVNSDLEADNYLDTTFYYKEILSTMTSKLTGLNRDAKRRILEVSRAFYASTPVLEFKGGEIKDGEIVKVTRDSIRKLKDRVRLAATQ